MKRILTLTLILLALPAAPAAASASHSLFVNGDSLAVGTQPYFPGALPGWSIRTSATISRHAFEGASVLRAQGSSLARVVFVSLGTNDDPRSTGSFRSSVRSIMSVVGPSRCVVWATIVRPAVAGASYAGYNRILKAEAKARPNLRVFRWRALLSKHPEWLGPDGVHVTGVGYDVRAREIAKKIADCPTGTAG
jgi:lysophospholipase L1-like esterase